MTWRDLGSPPTGTLPLSITVVGSDVLLGTESGLFRRPLDGSAEWSPSGLEQEGVVALRVSPTQPERVVASVAGIAHPPGATPGDPPPVAITFPDAPPIRWSTDGGRTWTRSGEELRWPDVEPPSYDYAADLAFTPDGRRLFANYANSLLESTDGGRTWTWRDGAPGAAGYPCHLAATNDHVWQGCELGLDIARIDSFELTPNGVGPRVEVIGWDELGNRRPNSMTVSAADPGDVWVGVEGALLRLSADTEPEWLFRGADTTDEYAYVRGVWLDPCDRDHLVFGGNLQYGNSSLWLAESFDDGASHVRQSPPPGVTAREWRIAAMTTPAVAATDLVLAIETWSADVRSARVLVRSHARR
ncbi:MAG: hypothetical protein U0326_44520 [Polyangiales bacterium]